MTFPGHTVELLEYRPDLNPGREVEIPVCEDLAVGSHIFDLLNRVNDFVGNQY